MLALRARNKILSDTLKAVKEQADEKAKRNFELVWFARNRSKLLLRACIVMLLRNIHPLICLVSLGRYPNHKASKFLEVKHAKELSKLRSPDGDYFHGFHAGVLATAKMFQEHADILHVNEHEELNEALQVEAVKHSKKILKSQESFPDLNTDKFPEVE